MSKRLLVLFIIFALALAAIPAQAAGAVPERVEPLDLEGAQIEYVPQAANPDAAVRVVVEMQGKPLVDEVEDAKQLGAPLSAEQQKAIVKKLKDAQDLVEQEVERHGGQVIAKYQRVYNGLAVRVARRELPSLLRQPGVAAIHAVHLVKPDNETSVPFIGATQVWQIVKGGVPVTGRGIRVAVIDTGIDYTHADFGGPGVAEAYKSNNPNLIEPGTFPTAKVVDGYDFVGTDYDASSDDPAKQVPHPDPDPLDEGGHGSHVAGTIAGFGVKNADGSWRIGPGVAPDTLLYAYKVFGREGSTDVVAEAIERAMDPNQDGDLSDHVDVINMSLGSTFGSPDDPSAVATQKAVRAGVIVVASAGNSGNVPYVTGSPAVAPGAISVASSLDNGIVFGAIRVNSPANLVGLMQAAEGAISKPLAVTGPITADVVNVGGTGATLASIPDTVAGKIALIDRGAVTFATKIWNAQAKGAIAVIVANNNPDPPIVMGGSSTGIDIPGVMISQADGVAIKNALLLGPVNVTLAAEIIIPRPDLADTLSSFTSRGPGRFESRFKPEIAAPGQDIRSVAMGSGSGAVLMSGTSMAAPHLSGVAALMRQLYPGWSVAEIKALLMNTATTAHQQPSGAPYPLSLQGAGRVQVAVAARIQSVALPGALAFGYRAITRDIRTVTRKIIVLNKSNASKTYNISWSFLQPSDYNKGVNLDIPTQVTVPARRKGEVEVQLTITPAALHGPNPGSSYDKGLNEYDGYITLAEAAGDTLRVPFQVLPAPASDVELEAERLIFSAIRPTQALELENGAANAGTASFYSLVGFSPRDPGTPAESDLQYAGVRAVPGANNEVLEFTAKTHGAWSTLQTNEFDFLVDTNGDGKADYIVFNYDLGLLTGQSSPSGQVVSAVYNLATRKIRLEYYLGNAGASYNTSVASLYADAADLGLSGTGSLKVLAVDAFGRENTDELVGNAPAINLANPAITVADPDLVVPAYGKAGTSATVSSTAGPLSDLLVTFPGNGEAEEQAQAVHVRAVNGD
ncbi:MAG: S8 family serine peptidase [Firmicutes bacterium]|nr:S8 family serine peptidase [Bacillota bacterium]